MCDSSYTNTTQTQSIIQSIWSITIKLNIGNIPICGEEEKKKRKKRKKNRYTLYLRVCMDWIGCIFNPIPRV